jgi:hypothetical protein
MYVRSKIRNPAHKYLKDTLLNIIGNIVKKDNPQAFVDHKEPLVENYFALRSNNNNVDPNEFVDSLPNYTRPFEKRRADIGIHNINLDGYKNIIIDVTMVANCSKSIIHYNKIGDAAQRNGVNKKHTLYNQYFKAREDKDTKLIIFAVENDGALAYESFKFLEWLLKSDSNYKSRAKTLLSIRIQTIRAYQIIFSDKNLGQ